MEGGTKLIPVEIDAVKTIIHHLDRIAKANEELIRLAVEERDDQEVLGEAVAELPVCPHCGTLNPKIRNEGGAGPMAEFALLAQCDSCSHTFIAEPQGWHTFKSKDEYEGREVDGNGT